MAGIRDVKACVFDAYGTLFDVHSAVKRYRKRIGEHVQPLSVLWRTRQLEYTWLRSLMGAHADFWQITGDALDYAMRTYGLFDGRLREDLMRAYHELDCYPEVKDSLAALKRRGIRTAILSNGTRGMIEAATAAAGLDELIDDICTVDELRFYNPHPKVYRLACERLALPAERISFQSANAWDAAGAAYFGMRVVWINRAGAQPERIPNLPDAELASLAGLPDLIG